MSRARSLNHLNAPLPLRLCEGDFLFLFQFRYSDVWKFFVIYAPKCRGNNALSWLTNFPMFGYEWFLICDDLRSSADIKPLLRNTEAFTFQLCAPPCPLAKRVVNWYFRCFCSPNPPPIFQSLEPETHYLFVIFRKDSRKVFGVCSPQKKGKEVMPRTHSNQHGTHSKKQQPKKKWRSKNETNMFKEKKLHHL